MTSDKGGQGTGPGLLPLGNEEGGVSGTGILRGSPTSPAGCNFSPSVATRTILSWARPVSSTSGDHTSRTVTYVSCFAFAFPNRAGFRRTTVAAPLRSAASRPPGTRLLLPLSSGIIHFHSQIRPRIKCRFQPIKKKLPQTFGGASTSTNDLRVFSSASFFRGEANRSDDQSAPGKCNSGSGAYQSGEGIEGRGDSHW